MQVLAICELCKLFIKLYNAMIFNNIEFCKKINFQIILKIMKRKRIIKQINDSVRVTISEEKSEFLPTEDVVSSKLTSEENQEKKSPFPTEFGRNII
jgi:hypothetical protein